MLHCCKCNKSKSPNERNKTTIQLIDQQVNNKIQENNNNQNQNQYIQKIKQNEQLIYNQYKQLEQENKELNNRINILLQEKKELQEKYNLLQVQSINYIPQTHSFQVLNETNLQYSTNQQSFQFNDSQSFKYQSLKKLFDDLIKDPETNKRNKSSIQFLKEILQQKQEDLDLAQEQIIKQNNIIAEYEYKYNQLLQQYSDIQFQLINNNNQNL